MKLGRGGEEVQNKPLLAVVGEIFGEDAQHKGPALPQLEQKLNESAPLFQMIFQREDKLFF